MLVPEAIRSRQTFAHASLWTPVVRSGSCRRPENGWMDPPIEFPGRRAVCLAVHVQCAICLPGILEVLRVFVVPGPHAHQDAAVADGFVVFLDAFFGDVPVGQGTHQSACCGSGSGGPSTPGAASGPQRRRPSASRHAVLTRPHALSSCCRASRRPVCVGLSGHRFPAVGRGRVPWRSATHARRLPHQVGAARPGAPAGRCWRGNPHHGGRGHDAGGAATAGPALQGAPAQQRARGERPALSALGQLTETSPTEFGLDAATIATLHARRRSVAPLFCCVRAAVGKGRGRSKSLSSSSFVA